MSFESKKHVLVIGTKSVIKMITWFNVSYAVHPDMKSHTNGSILFGRDAIVCKLTNQKINTKSSTEAGLVGLGNYVTYIIWARMILHKQRFMLEENKVMQENESAIKLAVHRTRLTDKQS